LSKTYKSISIIFLITIGIKIIDIVKNLIIASKLGVSNDADVFSALISVPDSLLVLVGIDSLRGVVNSEYSTQFSNKNYDDVNNSFNNLYKIVFFFSVPLFILVFVFNNELISVMFPGFTGLKKSLALQISVYILPVFLFKGLTGLLQSVYNSAKKFYYPVILSVLISICMIISVFLPYINDNLIFNLSIAYLISNILIVIFMALNFKNLGVSIDFSFPKMDDLTKKIIKSCGSIAVLVLFNQLFLSSRMFFASYYGEGAISSLNYSSAISSFIPTLAFNSIFSVLLSNMSSLDLNKDFVEIKKLYLGTIEVILFFFIPIAALFVIFDFEIIKLFYFRGNFTVDAVEKVSIPFVWDAISIISWIMYIIPTAFFLAIKKYRILAIYGTISYICGVAFNYYFSDLLGYYGVAVASVATTSLYAIFLLYQSKKILMNLHEFKMKILKLMFCGLISSLIVYIIKIKFLDIFIMDSSLFMLLSGSVFFALIFIFTASLLKVNYLKNIKNYIKF
jgi:putative peptidoglycan lipid II flippase